MTGWILYEDGTTVGSEGTEQGTIVLDEQLPGDARITLEGDCQTAPWSITCGVYGAMVHTRFFGKERVARREYEVMKRGLEQVVENPHPDALEDFCSRFP